MKILYRNLKESYFKTLEQQKATLEDKEINETWRHAQLITQCTKALTLLNTMIMIINRIAEIEPTPDNVREVKSWFDEQEKWLKTSLEFICKD